ncbi:hypothetical protein BDV09DRAFT_184712 [Aspergillus tetrazonus]
MQLPPELILLVIEALIPSESRILPPGHIVTRTLLSLSLTCKLTYPLARELLFTHCLYLNSGKRIEDVLNQSQLCRFGRYSPVGVDKGTRARSLFLAFPSPVTISLNSTDRQIDSLLSLFSTNVRCLIIDLPLRHLLFNDTENRRAQNVVYGAISRLEAVEEFCYLRDGLGTAPYRHTWLNRLDISAWSLGVTLVWPRLRRLALCNPAFDHLLVETLRQSPNLTHLAFTCPSKMESLYTDRAIQSLDFAQTFSHLQRVLILQGDGPLEITHPWDFWESRMVTQHVDRGNWEQSFLGKLMVAVQTAARSTSVVQFQPELVYINEPKTGPFDSEDYATFQEWTGTRALDGTLWDYPGLVYDVNVHGRIAAALFADAQDENSRSAFAGLTVPGIYALFKGHIAMCGANPIGNLTQLTKTRTYTQSCRSTSLSRNRLKGDSETLPN